MFGKIYYNPAEEKPCASIHEQPAKRWPNWCAGKVRAIGLSNETPYGVHEFIRWPSSMACRGGDGAEPYCLINRTLENGLDETMHRLGVSLLAYSPLGFGC